MTTRGRLGKENSKNIADRDCNWHVTLQMREKVMILRNEKCASVLGTVGAAAEQGTALLALACGCKVWFLTLPLDQASQISY